MTRTLHDGVLVAPELGVVYLMRPGGGIDGVDLGTGTVSWHTSEAAKPLALAGDLLIAQAESSSAGELPIVTFDTRRAGSTRSVLSIDLPEDLQARVDQGLGRAFRVWAANADTGEALVFWSSVREARSGLSPEVVDPRVAPVMPGVPQSVRLAADTRVEESGAARLDAEAGTIEAAVTEKAEVLEPGPALRELAAADRLAGAGGRQFLSIDRRHVLASERRTDGGPGERYRWTLYERSTGERLGGVESRISAAPFVVSHGGVLFVSSPHSLRREGRWTDAGLTLRSVDLTSGVERWVLDLRDTAYRGPFPQ